MTQIASDANRYRLLPFRFMRMSTEHERDILVTSDTGEYLFVSDAQLQALSYFDVAAGTPYYKDLLARHFIYEPDSHDPFPEMAAQ